DAILFQEGVSVKLRLPQPIALTKLSLNISPDDRVKIVVTVSDGQSLHLSQQWPPSSEKS
ncbi:curli assembly protein CsgC, partial [Shigella dysenteriae]|nr:curli assembly protein CsgC [Shigella dysenteriae]EFY0240124.1 curli assembly protein CsgC [Shigella dysenteriae]